MPADEELLELLRDSWSDLDQAHTEKVIGGLSGASVYRVRQERQPIRYLKIARNEAARTLREEAARTRWLATQNVRVPSVRRFEDRADGVILLSDALSGTSAETSSLPLPQLVDALAGSLAKLHALPVAGCPFDESLANRLSRAAAAVAAGEVDRCAFADRNNDVDPADLLARLAQTQPEEDVVVVHGDATLSNMIVDNNGDIGFVDCGNAGRGDRYIDLSVLSDYIREQFGQEAAIRFARAYREHTSAPWDAAKAGYFLDLYELF